MSQHFVSHSLERHLVPSTANHHNLGRRLVLMGLLTILVLIFLPWRQNIAVDGAVTALNPNNRPIEVEASIEGLVSVWHVQEGQEVQQGDLLVVLQDNDPKLQERAELQLRAAELKSELYEEKERVERKRLEAEIGEKQAALESADHEVMAAAQKVIDAEQKLQAAEAKLTTASINLTRIEKLREQGIRSSRELELAQLSVQTGQAEMQKAKALVGERNSYVKALRAKRSEKRNALEAARSKLDSALATIRVDQQDAQKDVQKQGTLVSRQMTREVRASSDGIVTNINIPGRNVQVKKGDHLLTLMPKTADRVVELFVSGRDIILIKPGRHVRLQFEGWPAIQFGGWPSVAVGSFPGEVIAVQPHRSKDGGFRILVQPDGTMDWPESRFLHVGLQVKGWILLDRVALGYEMWRLLNGFPPKTEIYGATSQK